MSQRTVRCRTDGFPLSDKPRESRNRDIAPAAAPASTRRCTNPWHPLRLHCPRCGGRRKIVLASPVVSGESVYLHCLVCRHLWQSMRLVP